MTLALVRGAFLNQFEMQNYEPLMGEYEITAFSSENPTQGDFSFPVVKLPSPTDLPNFPYKMPILNRIFKDAHVLFGLENKLKGYDVAHCAETYYYYTKQCLDAKKRGFVKKVVSTVWETIPFNNEGIRGRRGMKKRAIKEIDHFLAVTSLAKEALIKEGCDPNKISVTPMGVDLERFRPRNDIKEGVLKLVQDDSKVTVREVTETSSKSGKWLNVLFVGRLEEEKGVMDLVNTFAQLIEEGIEKTIGRKLLLSLVGKGSQEQKIKQIAKSSGVGDRIKISALPYQGIERIYQEADIFVLPSKPTRYWEEQFGMVLVEAMATGLPIISTYSGAIPEVIGDAGILVTPSDGIGLKDALKKLIDSPADRSLLGIKARKRSEELFDAKKQAEKINNLYKNLFLENET